MRTTLTCMGDDAPATCTKMLTSPLIDADGKLVPCSCRFSTACQQAGGRTVSSSFWLLASTSVPANFPIKKPNGLIKQDVKDKTPGSKLHAASIQRTILPGELLMCSACEQKQRNGQTVHHAVPALATACGCTLLTVACALCVLQAAAEVASASSNATAEAAAAVVALTNMRDARVVVQAQLAVQAQAPQLAVQAQRVDAAPAIGTGGSPSGSPSGSPGGSPDAAPHLLAKSTAAPLPSALGKRPRSSGGAYTGNTAAASATAVATAVDTESLLSAQPASAQPASAQPASAQPAAASTASSIASAEGGEGSGGEDDDRIIPNELHVLLNQEDKLLPLCGVDGLNPKRTPGMSSSTARTHDSNPRPRCHACAEGTCVRITFSQSTQQTARTRAGVANEITKYAVDLATSTFIDVGCGLGSIVWGMAYMNPSLTCIGVENMVIIYNLATKVRDGLRRLGMEPKNVELVHCDAIEYLSKTSKAGIVYCYDQGFTVSNPSAAAAAVVSPWCVRLHQDIDGLANALSNINFTYLMVSCMRSVKWWESKCKGIKYHSKFPAVRGGTGSGSYVVHVFTATLASAAATAPPEPLPAAPVSAVPGDDGAGDGGGADDGAVLVGRGEGEGGGAVLLRAAHASPASLLNPTTNLPTAQPSGGDGRAGGRRITHPPSKMDMVRTLDGLEKSMSQNVIVLGGALDGLTCAHTCSHAPSPPLTRLSHRPLR